LIAVSVALGSAGQILLKAGAAHLEGQPPLSTVGSAVTDPLVLGGLLAYAVSSLLWLLVLSRVDLSVAYPMAAASYVIVVAAGALRGEPVSWLRWLGVAFIVVGVSTIGLFEARKRARVEV
jgi:drug/metabolite transporter (DMT)-like permease